MQISWYAKLVIGVTCKKCGKAFTVKPSQIVYGYGKFCSRICAQWHVKNGKEVACSRCGVVIYRTRRMLARSKSSEYFCTKRCQTLWRNQLYVGEKHANWQHGRSVYRDLLKRSGSKQVCEVCGTKDQRILIVHHIDRNRMNNKPENLAWLCHNCHFLVHHYDVGHGREVRDL